MTKNQKSKVTRILIICYIIALFPVVLTAQKLEDRGTNIIMFLDKFAIENMVGLERKFIQPKPVEEFQFIDDNPLAGTMEYTTIIYDESQKKYRMWYMMHIQGRKKAICYAESADGMAWNLGSVPANADKLTAMYRNAVFSGERAVEQGAVSLDPYAVDPGRKFKLAYQDKMPDKNDQDKLVPVMRMAYSADGINWKIDKKVKWHPSFSDTKNQVFYNSDSKMYQISCRTMNLDRRIAMVESKDLVNWSQPKVIFHPASTDPIGMQFYGMPVFEYEGLHLGLLWKYQTGQTGNYPFRGDGYLEPELTYSYDASNWYRTHQTFIERPERGKHGGAGIYGESILLDHEGSIRIYSRGNLFEHQKWGGGTALIMHKLRRDGFVGLESYGYESYLKTKPFVLDDGNISMNIQAPYGRVRVQISDKAGNPYPGYSFADCILWTGDNVSYIPAWKDRKDLKGLIGKPVRFEIEIEQGTIYAIRGKMRPFHAEFPQNHY